MPYTSRYDETDSIRIYLKEIGRLPLLTAAQEIELAKTIAAGNAIEATPKQKDAAHRAEQKFVTHNLRLVAKVAKKYRSRGVAYMDLVQEGSIGVTRAAQKFDYTLGYKFSTYAYWWIRQAMTRAVANHSQTIRLPVHMMESLNKIKKTKALLLRDLGRKPSLAELAAAFEWPIEKLEETLEQTRSCISYDIRVGEEQDSALVDFIASQDCDGEEYVYHGQLRSIVATAMSSLSAREHDVIAMRYGLHGEPMTLQEIGVQLGLSRERVRQIQAAAIRKLRHPRIKAIVGGAL